MSNNLNVILEGPKQGRVRCCIIGCGRTFKDEGHTETMCAKHWRLGDKRLRLRIARVERIAKKRGGWSGRLMAAHHKIWVQVRDQAQRKSMGI